MKLRTILSVAGSLFLLSGMASAADTNPEPRQHPRPEMSRAGDTTHLNADKMREHPREAREHRRDDRHEAHGGREAEMQRDHSRVEKERGEIHRDAREHRPMHPGGLGNNQRHPGQMQPGVGRR